LVDAADANDVRPVERVFIGDRTCRKRSTGC
jgi:hypothetical protein